MKNTGIFCLLLIACVFLALLAGIFLGRNSAPSQIQISKLPQPSAPTEATDPLSSSQTDPTVGSIPRIININTATLEELDSLPGIGPVIAQRILDYREAHGPFTSVNQLTLVDGIGSERLEKILDYITV